jgi:hypothetical protein
VTVPDEVAEFWLDVPEAALADLRGRLRSTRWPERETVDDGSQGVPLAYMRDLCAYWAERYDWRALEARLNALPQFRTEIDGLGIHFLHVRSPHADALPLILTHGWPGSIVEFLKVLGPLTDPTSHGGQAGDAFHVVCPSLPGYGFSDKPVSPGWGVQRIAAAWIELMTRLGYDDCDGHLENVLTRDELLDNLMLYWLPGSAASSARLYWESIRQVNDWISGRVNDTVTAPAGCSIFPKELQRPSRRWAEKRFLDIRYWNEPPRGGHFAAFEQPESFVEELRAFFRLVR